MTANGYPYAEETAGCREGHQPHIAASFGKTELIVQARVEVDGIVQGVALARVADVVADAVAVRVVGRVVHAATVATAVHVVGRGGGGRCGRGRGGGS